jgi:hypothetical protein
VSPKRSAASLASVAIVNSPVGAASVVTASR